MFAHKLNFYTVSAPWNILMVRYMWVLNNGSFMLIGTLAGSGLRYPKTHHVHAEKMSKALNQVSSLVHRTASHTVLCQASALLHCLWGYFPSARRYFPSWGDDPGSYTFCCVWELHSLQACVSNLCSSLN